MAIQSLLVFLSLTIPALSWPQLPQDSTSIPIPYVPRSLPSAGEVESIGTWHVRHVSQQRSPIFDRSDDMSHTLQEELQGILSLPVVRAPKPGLVGRNIEVQLENRSDVAYYAQLQIGTPPQKVYAQLDTGSFELWVNPDCGALDSSSDTSFCRAVGEYDPSSSSSSSSTDETKTLSYGFGSADVTYYTDNIAFSEDVQLEDVKFGVADKGGTEDQFAGVLGIGYGKGRNTKYKNVIDEMADQGVMKTKAFSVALGSKSEDGGVIVFGGVDAAKFKGKLASLPIIPADEAPDKVARYWVQLDSISVGGGSKKDGTNIPVFLDTGATLTLLPPSVVKAIAADLNSQKQDDSGFYEVDCALVDEPGTVDFAFDGVTVKVPYAEIIREFRHTDPEVCYLGIGASDEYALLGDTFMRSAYVVFDLESDIVFMGQYENCGSDVMSIKSSSDLDGLQGSCGGDVEQENIDSSSSSTPTATSSASSPKGTRDAESITSDSATTTASRPQATNTRDTEAEPTESGSNSSDEDSDNAATTLEGPWLSISFLCIAVMAML